MNFDAVFINTSDYSSSNLFAFVLFFIFDKLLFVAKTWDCFRAFTDYRKFYSKSFFLRICQLLLHVEANEKCENLPP